VALPFFYKEDITSTQKTVVLDEDTSKHVVQVLRMKVGEALKLTNGKGDTFTCEITDDHRKRCEVKISATHFEERSTSKQIIAVSPLKNNSRFEWFLEKATEIGITGIIPLICERTEKSLVKMDRLKGILISAMLQSQQAWLPVLNEPAKFNDCIKWMKEETGCQLLIAHCEEDQKADLAGIDIANNAVILIGPEGDFTPAEIAMALANDFEPVSLGDTRLRTETAAMVAAVLLKMKKF